MKTREKTEFLRINNEDDESYVLIKYRQQEKVYSWFQGDKVTCWFAQILDKK